MKFSQISLGLFALAIAAGASATDDMRLTRQRETYQIISRLLTISRSEPTQALARSLLNDIRDYPLYPYAEYQVLSANKTGLTLTEIEDYQKRAPTLTLVNNLKKQWLQQLQEKKDWTTIVDNAVKLPNDKASQCIILQAESAVAKTEQKSTALLQQKLTELWLTGDSLPKQCDPLIAQWNKQGGLSNELTQQRAVLAFEKNNRDLLLHLVRQNSNPDLHPWLEGLYKLAESPDEIRNKSGAFYVERLSPEKPLDKRILLAAYPRYLKTVKDSEVKLPVSLFGQDDLHSNIAESFKLTEQQIREWKKILIGRLFDSEIPELQQWRDNQLLTLKDDALFERRIRTAIREKGDIETWLNRLSRNAANKDEWRYWRAKVLQKQGKKSQADDILTALRKEPRGFYPLLAAAETDTVYQPEMRTLKPAETQAGKTSAKNAADDNAVNPERQHAAVLQRIAELRYFNDNTNANTEWKNLLDNASFEQKLRLAEYAERRRWYDLQVEATIRAKAWSYIGLRLPNAYPDWFDLLLNGKKIDRTFAMAIARQESAWKPYVSSGANARGLMQLLPNTAGLTAQKARLPYNNESQLFDPFINIMLGTAHLQELYDKYGNNRILMAAAYNAGAHRVEQWLKKAGGRLTMAEFIASIPFFETRGYVQNVLAYDAYYQILQGKSPQLFSQEEYDRLY